MTPIEFFVIANNINGGQNSVCEETHVVVACRGIVCGGKNFASN